MGEELISQAYRQLNEQLHERRRRYGSHGADYAKRVLELCLKTRTRDVLDYGAGKGTLADALPFHIYEYDPAIPGISAEPKPHAIVVCTGVLEHVEPDRLNAVVRHLWSLTGRVAFVMVGLGPSHKFLPDGRNAHLIQETATWWAAMLSSRCKGSEMELGPDLEKRVEFTLWRRINIK